MYRYANLLNKLLFKILVLLSIDVRSAINLKLVSVKLMILIKLISNLVGITILSVNKTPLKSFMNFMVL